MSATTPTPQQIENSAGLGFLYLGMGLFERARDGRWGWFDGRHWVEGD